VLFGFNDSYFVIGDIAPQISSTITARKNRNCEIAGVKQIRIHDFRHSCAFLLIYKGANIITVSKFLGHTKIEETLNTYSHMFSTALDSVVSVIDSLEDE
jgi:integrase